MGGASSSTRCGGLRRLAPYSRRRKTSTALSWPRQEKIFDPPSWRPPRQLALRRWMTSIQSTGVRQVNDGAALEASLAGAGAAPIRLLDARFLDFAKAGGRLPRRQTCPTPPSSRTPKSRRCPGYMKSVPPLREPCGSARTIRTARRSAAHARQGARQFCRDRFDGGTWAVSGVAATASTAVVRARIISHESCGSNRAPTATVVTARATRRGAHQPRQHCCSAGCSSPRSTATRAPGPQARSCPETTRPLPSRPARRPIWPSTMSAVRQCDERRQPSALLPSLPTPCAAHSAGWCYTESSSNLVKPYTQVLDLSKYTDSGGPLPDVIRECRAGRQPPLRAVRRRRSARAVRTPLATPCDQRSCGLAGLT